MITVTKTFLPPIDEYLNKIRKIWETQQLTNDGPMSRELEGLLRSFAGTPHVLFMGNGTIAIQIAIKALGLKGKIITTPFSYVATTSTIVWENCEPVFADIDPHTLNIDSSKIENLIDEHTSGILATHVFGNTCNIEAIEKIAAKHNLKVIYDAAHCFGSKYKGESAFAYGDVATTSFHATKLFHTGEGGAVFTRSEAVFKAMRCMRSFGYEGPIDIPHVGINGKNSEFHAAMGLTVWPYIQEILERRKQQSDIYDSFLNGVNRQALRIEEDCSFNYAYYPLIAESESLLLKVKYALEAENIFGRRYFSPSLSTLHYVKYTPTPVSDDISSRILCLPVYHDLTVQDQEKIAGIVKRVLSHA